MEMTLGEAFARSARKYPKKIACMDDLHRLIFEKDFSGKAEELRGRLPQIRRSIGMGGDVSGFALNYEALLEECRYDETVKDLVEGVIIGVPNPKWEESIRAIIVPRPGSDLTEESGVKHCRKHLASYKKPTPVIFVDELPKGTFGGKVLKRALREKYGKP